MRIIHSALAAAAILSPSRRRPEMIPAYFDAFAANCGGYACRLSVEEGKPVLLDARRFERLPEELS